MIPSEYRGPVYTWLSFYAFGYRDFLWCVELKYGVECSLEYNAVLNVYQLYPEWW